MITVSLFQSVLFRVLPGGEVPLHCQRIPEPEDLWNIFKDKGSVTQSSSATHQLIVEVGVFHLVELDEFKTRGYHVSKARGHAWITNRDSKIQLLVHL